MTLIIDPPVSPASTLEALDAWIEELEGMRERFDDPPSLEIIDGAIEEARRWRKFKAQL